MLQQEGVVLVHTMPVATDELNRTLDGLLDQSLARFRHDCVGGIASEEVAPAYKELEQLLQSERTSLLKNNSDSISRKADAAKTACLVQAEAGVLS